MDLLGKVYDNISLGGFEEDLTGFKTQFNFFKQFNPTQGFLSDEFWEEFAEKADIEVIRSDIRVQDERRIDREKRAAEEKQKEEALARIRKAEEETQKEEALARIRKAAEEKQRETLARIRKAEEEKQKETLARMRDELARMREESAIRYSGVYETPPATPAHVPSYDSTRERINADFKDFGNVKLVSSNN
jgi:hypothetical protein